MALVIPIVILLLTTAIFAIYCFKKRADRAEETQRKIDDLLPDFNQASPQSDSVKNAQDNSIGSFYRNDITPGLVANNLKYMIDLYQQSSVTHNNLLMIASCYYFRYRNCSEEKSFFGSKIKSKIPKKSQQHFGWN